jgi:c-di-GMP-related signal transduction protein
MTRSSDPGHTPVSGATFPSTLALQHEHLTSHVRYASQPIIDRAGRVVASELLFRWNASDALVEPHLGAYATASVLSNALLDGELLTRSPAAEHPIGDLLVNVDGATLMGPIAEALTPDVGVIELLETVEVDEAITARIRDLHGRGYRFALDDVVWIDDPRWALAPWVQFAKVDMLGLAPAQLRRLVRKAHRLGLAVIAEKIEDAHAHERARADGADYFQGFGIAAPMTLAVPALPGCEARVLGQLYLLACAGVRASSLAFVAGRHPAVVARLLRMQEIHAPQFAASARSLTDVLESLPRAVLTAWLAVLNIAAAHGRDRDLALWLHGELAHGRARLKQDGGIRSSEVLERASFLICKQLLRMRLQPRPESGFRSRGRTIADAEPHLA